MHTRIRSIKYALIISIFSIFTSHSYKLINNLDLPVNFTHWQIPVGKIWLYGTAITYGEIKSGQRQIIAPQARLAYTNLLSILVSNGPLQFIKVQLDNYDWKSSSTTVELNYIDNEKKEIGIKIRTESSDCLQNMVGAILLATVNEISQNAEDHT